MQISDDNLLIFISFFISISFYLETMSFLSRAIGYELNMSSSGYSFHVQISTLSRLGTLIGLPLMGILIDNRNFINLLLLPICVSFIFVIITLISLFFLTKIIKLFKILFCLRFNVIYINVSYKSNFKINKEIFLYGFLSYFFVNLAFFLVPVLAVVFYSNRAFIIQLSGLITGVGTFIGIFFFDHKLSKLLDLDLEGIDSKLNIIENVIFSRLITMAFIFFIGVLAYYIFL